MTMKWTAVLDKLLQAYCKLLGVVIALLLALMVVLVFTNVVLRYGFNSGITESEELSRWFFVWLTFLGAVIAVHEHGHLGTDFLIGRLNVMGQKICLVLGYVLMLFMCWLIFKGSLEQTIINLSVQAPATGLSQAWFYSAGIVLAISAALMLALDFIKLLTGQVRDEDLVMIRESEEQAITSLNISPTASGDSK
jgi:TRAP-type C4-dicarboxylate transport system permease small subunit